MIVEYLEKYLVNEDTESLSSKQCDFHIPELEVRPANVSCQEAVEPMISDPPPLCECDEFGSICGVCKIALDKIRSSTPPSSPCSEIRLGSPSSPSLLQDIATGSHPEPPESTEEGTCHEGDGVRLHKKCDKICDRPLVCGHTCKWKSGLPWMVLFS